MLGRRGESVQDLDPRGANLAGPLANSRLEQLAVPAKVLPQPSRLKQVHDAKSHLLGIERLAQEVLRARAQRSAPGPRVY
jgi:hypothetical protein